MHSTASNPFEADLPLARSASSLMLSKLGASGMIPKLPLQKRGTINFENPQVGSLQVLARGS